MSDRLEKHNDEIRGFVDEFVFVARAHGVLEALTLVLPSTSLAPAVLHTCLDDAMRQQDKEGSVEYDVLSNDPDRAQIRFTIWPEGLYNTVNVYRDGDAWRYEQSQGPVGSGTHARSYLRGQLESLYIAELWKPK